ncbi:hypothetical protein AB4Z21_19420 [Paenibacillus sp. MCAF20]
MASFVTDPSDTIGPHSDPIGWLLTEETLIVPFLVHYVLIVFERVQ